MAIFNSYVSLPEGTYSSSSRVVFVDDLTVNFLAYGHNGGCDMVD
jgi:hypothetical protein